MNSSAISGGTKALLTRGADLPWAAAPVQGTRQALPPLQALSAPPPLLSSESGLFLLLCLETGAGLGGGGAG